MKKYYTVNEYAKVIWKSRQHIYNLIKDGILQTVKEYWKVLILNPQHKEETEELKHFTSSKVKEDKPVDRVSNENWQTVKWKKDENGGYYEKRIHVLEDQVNKYALLMKEERNDKEEVRKEKREVQDKFETLWDKYEKVRDKLYTTKLLSIFIINIFIIAILVLMQVWIIKLVL